VITAVWLKPLVAAFLAATEVRPVRGVIAKMPYSAKPLSSSPPRSGADPHAASLDAYPIVTVGHESLRDVFTLGRRDFQIRPSHRARTSRVHRAPHVVVRDHREQAAECTPQAIPQVQQPCVWHADVQPGRGIPASVAS
jgi:hypothetical protein